MKADTLSLLCDPQTHEPLQMVPEVEADGQAQTALVNPRSGKHYPVRNGIPSFLDGAEVTGSNRKYKDLYDRIARGYDISEVVGGFLMYGGRDKVRRAILQDIHTSIGNKVLEVSIGTGTNLRYLTPEAEFFGLDISIGMLEQCQRNLRKWQINAELVHGTAESLPFRDDVFDVVFHVGGINFFNDKLIAILEMIRVARPGTRIHIGDETEELATQYANTPLPFARDFYGDRPETIVDPIGLVPPEMLDVRSRSIWNGKFYMLSFNKPS
jgi:ubiquinone/menaquinone biosynthesis C-methylase UbiE